MNEITVRSEDLEITIRVDRSLEALSSTPTERRIVGLSPNRSSSSFSPGSRAGSKAERVREIARGILSDGEPHKRKEIVQAVRAAGLDPQSLTVQLNGHFERVERKGEVFYEAQSVEGDELEEDFEIRRIEEALSPNGGGQ